MSQFGPQTPVEQESIHDKSVFELKMQKALQTALSDRESTLEDLKYHQQFNDDYMAEADRLTKAGDLKAAEKHLRLGMPVAVTINGTRLSLEDAISRISTLVEEMRLIQNSEYAKKTRKSAIWAPAIWARLVSSRCRFPRVFPILLLSHITSARKRLQQKRIWRGVCSIYV